MKSKLYYIYLKILSPESEIGNLRKKEKFISLKHSQNKAVSKAISRLRMFTFPCIFIGIYLYTTATILSLKNKNNFFKYE